MSHGAMLVLAYAIACGAWWLLSRTLPLWRAPARPSFAKPWIEVGIVLLAAVGVLGLGQLWSHGIRLELPRPWYPLGESLNQLLIFSPILLVPVLRRQGWASAWIQRDRLPARLAVGLVLALGVLAVYSVAEAGSPGWITAVRHAADPGNAHLAVQVLLEDVTIAILFVRFAAALSPLPAIGVVAALFAVGHVPAMLADGVSLSQSLGLLRDAGLGVLVIGTLWRGADIAWFWPVHYALDLTQFLGHTT